MEYRRSHTPYTSAGTAPRRYTHAAHTMGFPSSGRIPYRFSLAYVRFPTQRHPCRITVILRYCRYTVTTLGLASYASGVTLVKSGSPKPGPTLAEPRHLVKPQARIRLLTYARAGDVRPYVHTYVMRTRTHTGRGNTARGSVGRHATRMYARTREKPATCAGNKKRPYRPQNPVGL